MEIRGTFCKILSDPSSQSSKIKDSFVQLIIIKGVVSLLYPRNTQTSPFTTLNDTLLQHDSSPQRQISLRNHTLKR